MTADDKYSLLKRDNLTEPIHDAHYLKNKKLFLQFFLAISKFYIKFWTFSKKRWPS